MSATNNWTFVVWPIEINENARQRGENQKAFDWAHIKLKHESDNSKMYGHVDLSRIHVEIYAVAEKNTYDTTNPLWLTFSPVEYEPFDPR